MTISDVTPLRVLLVDDHPTLRAGVAATLLDLDDVERVVETATGEAALTALSDEAFDVTIIDLQLPDGSGDDLIETALTLVPDLKILILTSFGGEDTIRRCIERGAKGYLTKDALRRQLVSAVRRVARGERVIEGDVGAKLAQSMMQDRLTPREVDVLREMALGQSNKQIARALGISAGTVKVHVAHVIQKLEATDRTEAVMRALSRGTIRLR